MSFTTIKRVTVNKDFQYLLPTSEVCILFDTKESIGSGKILAIEDGEYIIELNFYEHFDLSDKDVSMSLHERSNYDDEIKTIIYTHFHIQITLKEI